MICQRILLTLTCSRTFMPNDTFDFLIAVFLREHGDQVVLGAKNG
jgi:hypothetical protein